MAATSRTKFLFILTLVLTVQAATLVLQSATFFDFPISAGRAADIIERGRNLFTRSLTLPPANATTNLAFPVENRLSASPDPSVFLEKHLVYEIKRGETLASIWLKNGAPRGGAERAAKAFKDAGLKIGALRAGEQLELVLSPANDITTFRRELSDGRTLILDGNSTAGYQASILQPDVFETQRTVSGTIFSSLSAAASDLQVPYQVVDEFVDLFSSRIEFRKSLQPGDTFTISYDEKRLRSNNKVLSIGRIRTASLLASGNLIAAVQHAGKDGQARYFDERGQALGNYFLRYPLNFTRISSAFSWARFHPLLQITRPHYGVDFAAPVGTPVRSVADGLVTEARYTREGGNTIKIQHGAKYTTVYMHLSRIAAEVRKGARVARGQVIGAVGSTGVSTGPHLHFALFDRGTYLDPLKSSLPSMQEGIDPIPPALLAQTLQAMRAQHASIALAANSSEKRNA